MKQILLSAFGVLTALFCLHPGFSQKPRSSDSIDHISKKVADWQLQSWATDGWPHPKYDWTNGAAYAGLLAFAREGKDSTYFDFLKGIGKDLNWTTGPRRYLACLPARSGSLSR